jgi:hypothetical protein
MAVDAAFAEKVLFLLPVGCFVGKSHAYAWAFSNRVD